ncbi:DUF3134 domain-containing protein [Stenomitos frigidus]|uniref:DUF3134 domain-containing protein n=1 Tax=Stenomitos frigidus ULC18 TaxID=2107698 RepID=A0A2T1DTR8_9CYAN|nr:DUF3134 domain-containing protein [Stenomitos frigidus]PSB23898.1 hypothetical protein C7B82_29410 [Stenomitos frigidus ULC18]
MTYNPSLREEPRSQRAAVIPLKQEASILDWLENTGRLLARDNQEVSYLEADGEELNALMAGEDNSFDIDDDDDDDLELED